MPRQLPTGLDQELDAIEKQRALAYALRLRMMQGRDPDQVVNGVLMPNLSGLWNSMGVGSADRELEGLDKRQREAIAGHERKVAEAYKGLGRLANPFAPVEDEAEILAGAVTAGLDVSDIQKQRGQARQLQGLLGNNMGFGPPARAGAAPGSPVPSGAPSVGGAPSARPSSPGGGDETPLAWMNDGQLMVTAAVMSGAPGELAKAELARRKIDVKTTSNGGVIVMQGGKPLPQDHPVVAQIQEAALLYQKKLGDLEVETAGRKEADKAAQDIVTVNVNGRPTQMTRAQAAQQFGGGGAPAAPQGLQQQMRIPPDVQRQRDLAGAALKTQEGAPQADIDLSRRYADRAQPPPSGATGFGVGQTPAEVTAAQEAAKTEELVRRGQVVPDWREGANQYTTAPPMAPGQAVTPAGLRPKPPENYAKQTLGIKNLNSAIDDYLGKLDDWKGWQALSPDARANMNVSYQNMLLQAKEAYLLGVLNGPDFMILSQTITSPSSLTGAITSNKALAKQAADLRAIMARNQQNANAVYQQPGSQGAPGGGAPRRVKWGDLP